MRSRAPYSGVFALLLVWVVLAMLIGAALMGMGWVMERVWPLIY